MRGDLAVKDPYLPGYIDLAEVLEESPLVFAWFLYNKTRGVPRTSGWYNVPFG